MKKNGFNMDIASVHCSAPASMIADLVANHLSLAGFRVLRDRQMAGPAAIILTGTLERAFVEPKSNFVNVEIETDFALSLSATTASGLSAERRFYVKGDEATVFGGADDMQRSFDSGVRQLVTGVVGAVANLAERFPPPGSAASPAPPSAAPEPNVNVQETN